ncbi:MAG: hypothetical protein AAGN82_21565 [Myxococcota bacterium]
MAPKVEKVSVAIGKRELAWARGRAAREGTSLSAVLRDAARVARQVEEARARQEAAWAAFLDGATDGRGLTSDDLASATYSTRYFGVN